MSGRARETASDFHSVAPQLTPAEGRVLRALLLGESNKEIASRYGCALRTVELHVTNLLRKHGVTSRTRLIVVVHDGSQQADRFC